MRNKFIILATMSLCLTSLYSCENISDLVTMLDKYKRVSGPVVGAGAQPSEQWLIYKKIKTKFSVEEIKAEFYKTGSVVTKIYLFWALREKNYSNLSIIKEQMKTYNDELVEYCSYGCLIYDEKVQRIIEDRLDNTMKL